MKFTSRVALLVVFCLCSACANAGQATPAPFSIATLSVSQAGPEAPTDPASSTPVSSSEFVLSTLPKCEGMKTLDQPVKFNWPNIDLRIKELEGSYWGYFSCPQPQETVAKFYREQMPKPPYNLNETNWVSRAEGVLGVYFHPPSGIWTYLWIVPQPEDAQSTYVIAAKSNGQPFQGGECFLDRSGRQTSAERSLLEWAAFQRPTLPLS